MTNITLRYRPRKFFIPFHERTQRHAVMICHRRAGKTVAILNEGIKVALTLDKPNPQVAYFAPVLKQARRVIWKQLKEMVKEIPGHIVSESHLTVTFPNGGEFAVFGSDNYDALRGDYLDLCIMDEYAQMPHDMYAEVIRPMLADRHGRAIFIGTPHGHDPLLQMKRAAIKNPKRYYYLELKASETGLISQEELDESRESATEAQYNREWECSFEASADDQFIGVGEVRDAFARESYPHGPILMGVDVARFGDDRTVIILRNGDQLLGENIYIYRGLDVMQVAARVSELAMNTPVPVDRIFIDGIGIGAGVVDRLKQLGFEKSVRDINVSRSSHNKTLYKSLKDEMWDRMRAWIRNRADLPENEELLDDLVAPRYKFTRGTDLLQIESKADMKARGLPSCDIADALALTFAERVRTTDVKDFITSVHGKANSAVPAVNPLNDFTTNAFGDFEGMRH